MTYYCHHCGQRAGMYGHFQTETDPLKRPVAFCPKTVEIVTRGQWKGSRQGFACPKDHECRSHGVQKRLFA